jgi:fatty-acyl-CoA synthase
MYGQTETSPVSTMLPLDAPLEVKLRSVGKVGDHVEVAIVDKSQDESGISVPRGTVGELLVRGYSVMMKYWEDEKATAGTIDEQGWLHSGDLAIMVLSYIIVDIVCSIEGVLTFLFSLSM